MLILVSAHKQAKRGRFANIQYMQVLKFLKFRLVLFCKSNKPIYMSNNHRQKHM